MMSVESFDRPPPRRLRKVVGALVLAAAVAIGIVTPPALPAEAADPMEGYLFAYFAGEGTADGEQIRFAVSRGNNAIEYDVLNQGRPILVSTVGTRGVRDPHVLRKQDGSFVLIATDLRIYGNGNWDASQRTGSRSIVIWESPDLVNWSAPRLQVVADATAGNVWAPEAIWDPSLNAYVVFWASKIYSTGDPNHTANTYNKMLYATTTDFRTFSTPSVWKDPGYSVIDSTVIADAGSFYRFTKDERGTGTSSPCGKFIIQERSTVLTSTNYTFQRDCIGQGSVGAGEGPTIVKSNTENRWYLFIDEFGGRGYVPFTTTDLTSGTWTEVANAALPNNPRHGSVMQITRAELLRLAGATTQIAPTLGNTSMRATTAGYTNYYWRHRDYVGVTAATTSSSSTVEKLDSTFTVVSGLANPSCASFRSRNFPDRYLRHYGLALRLDTATTATANADATFCAVPGKSGTGVSWRSYNVPTRFIRHYNSALYISSSGGTNAFDSTTNFNADVTWAYSAPWG